jgi:hypothetical protein
VQFEFEAEIWRWQARTDDGWLFVTVPEELSADIREVPRMPRGFGSVRVRVRIGATEWMTSIFPSGDTYALPLKKAVRKAEGLELGDVCTVRLDTVD